MQGDIFQMEQMVVKANTTHFDPIPFPVESDTDQQVAIYNEDDLSHLLYVNHLHHNGHKEKVFINHVYRDGYTTPMEPMTSGTQTPVSEINETPVFSDCESDSDEGVYSLSSWNARARRNPLRFEDGFEFPVFLGRQSEDSLAHANPADESKSDLASKDQHVRIATLEDTHPAEISGPLMSWWPEPVDMMEHEWPEATPLKQKSEKQVSDIDGPLMSWWPAPLALLEHEWDERFYE